MHSTAKTWLWAPAVFAVACTPNVGAVVDAGLVGDAGVVGDAGTVFLADGGALDGGKIAFRQNDGCINDGSNEFCVAKADFTLIRQIKQLMPSAVPTEGRGRAGCDLSVEQLYVFPTPRNDPTVCTADGGLTDEAWQQVVAVAALPEIRLITPTWHE